MIEILKEFFYTPHINPLSARKVCVNSNIATRRLKGGKNLQN